MIRHLNSNIYFKSEKEKNEFPYILNRLSLVIEDLSFYFEAYGHKLIITDLLEEIGESEKLKRVSTSHKEGRACDLMVRHLPKEFIEKVISNFNESYKSIAAISSSTGKPTLIAHHDNGNGIHFHVQIRPYKEV